MSGRKTVTRFYRGARRHPNWDMGTPPGGRRGPGRSPRRGWRRRITLAAVGVCFLVPIAAEATLPLLGPRHPQGCRIVSVTDGDTIRLYCPSRGIEKARLTGFDTPEVFNPECVAEWVRGMQASIALRLKIWRAKEFAFVRQGTDRYGRALVMLSLDGLPVARGMVADGLARVYRGGVRASWCERSGA